MHAIAISKKSDNSLPLVETANPIMDARLRRTLELPLHELQRRLPASLTPREEAMPPDRFG
jgi:hypothetical protein